VQELSKTQEESHRNVLRRAQQNRAQQRQVASKGQIPNFAVGDFVMVARFRKRGSRPKLVSTWTGLRRVVEAETPHVYQVQNIISKDLHEVHVSRLRFYSNKELEVTKELKETFQYMHNQGDLEMSAIVDLCKKEDEYVVFVH
ncbi:unnamed protein product, partial [Choristocarpus tenellus]